MATAQDIARVLLHLPSPVMAQVSQMLDDAAHPNHPNRVLIQAEMEQLLCTHNPALKCPPGQCTAHCPNRTN